MLQGDLTARHSIGLPVPLPCCEAFAVKVVQILVGKLGDA